MYFGGITFPRENTRSPENNSSLRSMRTVMRTTTSPGSSPFSAAILKTGKTLGTRLSMCIEFYSCQTAKNMAASQRNTNEIFSAKKHGEDVLVNEEDDTTDRGQGEKEASGAESEISKFFWKKVRQRNKHLPYLQKEKFFLLLFFAFWVLQWF